MCTHTRIDTCTNIATLAEDNNQWRYNMGRFKGMQMDMGTAIRILRKVTRTKVVTLVKQLGTSNNQVSNVYRRPSLNFEVCTRYADALGVSLDELRAVAEYSGRPEIQKLILSATAQKTNITDLIPGVIDKVEQLLQTMRSKSTP